MAPVFCPYNWVDELARCNVDFSPHNKVKLLELNTIISPNVNVALIYSAHSKSITAISSEAITHFFGIGHRD